MTKISAFLIQKYDLSRLYLFLLLSLISTLGYSQQFISKDSIDHLSKWDKFRLSGYGVVNYYSYKWQSLPDKRNAFDPERLNLYFYHDFSDKIELKTEIEFEHGGSGVTMEFDPLEEFGEFEQSVEKGGEVVVEQLNLFFKWNRHFNLRVGKMRIYMGNAANHDEPKEYFTSFRSEVENTILPLGWYETGIELSGNFQLHKNTNYPRLSYKGYLMSGLDNTGFSSANWIRRGYQTRFETINADNLATAFRLDYQFRKDNEIGFAIYTGNTTGNRPKNDLKADVWVTYGDIHLAINRGPVRIVGYGMYGNVQNSDQLSTANRNLSNNLDVKRTPVAKNAAGLYLEAGYDILSFWSQQRNENLYVFARIEWYDSMYKTVGNISDNPRYERTVFNLGINYLPLSSIVLKAHYNWRTLGSGEQDETLALGIGFDF